jgi:hypothetical protein
VLADETLWVDDDELLVTSLNVDALLRLRLDSDKNDWVLGD